MRLISSLTVYLCSVRLSYFFLSLFRLVLVWYWHWWHGLWQLYGIKDFYIKKNLLKRKKSLYRDIYCYRDIKCFIFWYKILLISLTPNSAQHCFTCFQLELHLIHRAVDHWQAMQYHVHNCRWIAFDLGVGIFPKICIWIFGQQIFFLFKLGLMRKTLFFITNFVTITEQAYDI